MPKTFKKVFHSFVVLALVVGNFAFLPVPRTADAETVNSYRWRNDDGSETAATWAAATNTAINLDKGVNKRLRFGVENDGTESELLREAAASLGDYYDDLKAAVIDASNDFVYFAQSGSPSVILKVRLSTRTLVDTLTLDASDGYITYHGGTIDTANGKAYFVTNLSPGKIVKVDLATFTKDATLTLNSGENYLRGPAVDSTYLYVVTATSPSKVVRVTLSTFTRDSVITLTGATGSNQSEIDTANNKGYTVTNSHICRFSTDTFAFDLCTSVGTLTGSLVLDTDTSKAYVATTQSPAVIRRYSLPGLTLDTTLTLNSGENKGYGMGIDKTDDLLIVGTDEGYGPSTGLKVVKIDISSLSLTRSGAVTLNTGESRVLGAFVLDVASDDAWVGTYDSPADIVEVDYGALTRTGSVSGISGASLFSTSVIDTENGFLYAATYQLQASIIKFRLSDMTLIDTISLSGAEEQVFTDSAIDTTNGFAYFITEDYTATTIVKINLSTFTYVDSLTLQSDEAAGWNASTLMLDVEQGYLYVATYADPIEIVRVSLSSFTRDTSLTLDAGDSYAVSASIDTAGDYILVATEASPAKVIKVNIAPLTFAKSGSTLTLSAGEEYAYTMELDAANDVAYIGTWTFPGKVVKVDTSGASPTRTSVLTFGSTEGYAVDSAADFDKGLVYFLADSSPTHVIQIETSGFTKENSLQLTTDDVAAYAMSIDSSKGLGYLTSYSGPSKVIRLSITPNLEPRLEYAVKSGSCGASSGWTQVASSSGSGPWKMYDSSYLTHAAATTNTGDGVTDGNTNFLAGEVLDTSSQMSRIALGFDDFTEVEYSIQPTAAATDGATYCFRLTDAGSASGLTYGQYAEATLASSAQQTVVNAATLSRHKIGESSTFALSFDLTGTLSTTTTVTFPSGFTVTGAFTGGTCSGGGTISNFSYTSTTLTADKSGCSGTVTLSGAVITLPGTAGDYVVTWVNDQPGSTIIPVADDDQVTVTASVDPTMTFDLDIATSDSDTDAPYAVALGALGVGSVTGSDDSGINGIWIDLEANASSGAVVQIKNANGTSGLVSASAPGDTIPSLTGENSMSAGTANYGVCVADAGNGVPTASVGTLQEATGIFDGACGTTPGSNAAGGLTTTFTDILDSNSAALAGGRAQIRILAAIADTTVGHDDYADTITLRATGTF